MNTKCQQRNHWNRGCAQMGVRALAIAVIFAVCILAAQSASAQTYRVLYTFTGGADGGSPMFVRLLRDGAGNLYGTTAAGGTSNNGTVFKLDSKGKETVLHSFTLGTDGGSPESGLVKDGAGNLYGTTHLGGGVICNLIFASNGCGVVFKLSKSGTLTVLHSFTGADGAYPTAALLRDAKGNLYSTTYGGGDNPSCPGQTYQNGCGTVFKLTHPGGVWNQTVLYSFGGASDGWETYADLIADPSGNLYGTTNSGGPGCPGNQENDCGTVFELKPGPNGWTKTVLYTFLDGTDGANLWDGLIRDAEGNLYGTTQFGGTAGFGTIFQVDAAGKKTTLHSFTGADGAYPTAPPVRDLAGNLYGTTFQGGTSKVGTVFRIDASGTLTVLHNFTGGTDGAYPFGPVIRDVAGNLYGTTDQGGPQNAGIVYKLKP